MSSIVQYCFINESSATNIAFIVSLVRWQVRWYLGEGQNLNSFFNKSLILGDSNLVCRIMKLEETFYALYICLMCLMYVYFWCVCLVYEEVVFKELLWRPSGEAREPRQLTGHRRIISHSWLCISHLCDQEAWHSIRTSRRRPRRSSPRWTRRWLTRSWRRSMLCTNRQLQETSTSRSQEC